MTGSMLLHGIQCPRCHEEVYSLYRHDFRHCPCGYCYIDGGQEGYVRIGWGDEEGRLYGEPIPVSRERDPDGNDM